MAPFKLHDDERGIDIHGWSIRAVEGSIASSAVEEQIARRLGIKLPSMLFDQNLLSLRYAPDAPPAAQNISQPVFELAFRVADALSTVGDADPNIKVKAAERWASSKQRSDVEITTLDRPSDWTFSTRYAGTITPPPTDIVKTDVSPSDDADGGVRATRSNMVQIDYDALRDTALPILFSAQLLLFEDELDDNGTAFYRVRIRVMPTFVFVLARFFLRIDSVLVRVHDTRYFHRFDDTVVVRETVCREANLATSLRHLHPSIIRDPDMLAPHVPITSSSLENIPLAALN